LTSFAGASPVFATVAVPVLATLALVLATFLAAATGLVKILWLDPCAALTGNVRESEHISTAYTGRLEIRVLLLI
jgi:hypothetical protein